MYGTTLLGRDLDEAINTLKFHTKISEPKVEAHFLAQAGQLSVKLFDDSDEDFEESGGYLEIADTTC